MQITKTQFGYGAQSTATNHLGLAVRTYAIDRPDTIQPAAVRKFWSVRIFENHTKAREVQGEFTTKKEAVAYVRAYEAKRAEGVFDFEASKGAFEAALDVRYPE